MSDLMVASTQADARAGEAMIAHHAELAATLRTLTNRLTETAWHGRAKEIGKARGELVAWCLSVLVPHALAEEATLYPAAAARLEASLLVTAMLSQHEVLVDLVDEIAGAQDAAVAVGAAHALVAVAASHLATENDLLIPLLVGAHDISLADLVERMEVSAAAGVRDPDLASAPSDDGHHACACGEDDAGSMPELDVRTIPHAIRHASVFGALHAVAPGAGLVLLVHHDPAPLLAQIEQREPGVFTVEYLERGPETWRIAIARRR